MRAINKYIFIPFSIILFAVAVTFHLSGCTILSVQSDSMVPMFKQNDALVVRPVRYEDLRIGDVISYHNPNNPKMVVSHRLIGVNNYTGNIITAGDALDIQDAPVSARFIEGRVEKVLPGAGVLLDGFHQPIFIGLTVYVPALLILISEIKRLARSYSHGIYHLYSYRYKH